MDWAKLIGELRDVGMTQQQIAEACSDPNDPDNQIGQSTISDIETGKTKSPRFSLGQKLIELHRRRTKRARAAA